MIKQIHEIRLKDIILLDATKSARSLMRFPLPIWLFKKKLNSLIKEIFSLIGGQTIDTCQDDFDKLLSYRRLMLLEALYKAVMIEIGLKPKIIAMKILLEREIADSPYLMEVLAEVKRLTGIDITTPEDLQVFTEYIQHKVDKHKEVFPDRSEEVEEVKLTKVIYSVFNYLGEPYNESMRLITFIELKSLAEERSKQSNTKDDGIE